MLHKKKNQKPIKPETVRNLYQSQEHKGCETTAATAGSLLEKSFLRNLWCTYNFAVSCGNIVLFQYRYLVSYFLKKVTKIS